ncbi:MAG: hypothetical protein K6D02_01125 [Lachnospiraceae bacterium]|nr:hypothetical protein [Lachnospiraceae bacterium]
MSDNKEVRVYIDGHQYILISSKSDEYVHKLASYIDSKIQDYGRNKEFFKLDEDKRNVLVNINIADDYYSARDELDEIKETKRKLQEDFFDLKNKISEKDEEIIALRDQLEKVSKSHQTEELVNQKKLKESYIAQLERLKKQGKEEANRIKIECQKAINKAKADAESEIKKIKENSESELARVRAEAETEINKAKAEAQVEISRVKTESDAKVSKIKEESLAKISDEKQKSQDSLNKSRDVSQSELDTIRNEKDKLIEELRAEKDAEIEKLKEVNREQELENVRLTERLSAIKEGYQGVVVPQGNYSQMSFAEVGQENSVPNNGGNLFETPGRPNENRNGKKRK